MLEAEAQRARGAQKPPTPGEELRKVPGSHPELQIHLQNPPPPAQPITLLPLTARAAAELLQQKKSQKKPLLCNICLLWGVCTPSAKEIRWFQGNPWHRELPGGGHWHHPSPAPPRGLCRTLRAMICPQICCCSAPEMFALNLCEAKTQEERALMKALRHKRCRGG